MNQVHVWPRSGPALGNDFRGVTLFRTIRNRSLRVGLVATVAFVLSSLTVATPASAAAYCAPPLTYANQSRGVGQDLILLSNCGNTTTTLALSLGRYSTLSPDGTEVATTTGTIGTSTQASIDQVHIRAVDGSSDRLINPDSGSTSPAWSPDGRQLAFADAFIFVPSAPRSRHINIVALDGSGQRQITSDPTNNDFVPTWSPDGQHIAFIRHTGDDNLDHIYMVDPTGENQKELYVAPSGTELQNPTWTPDSNYVVFPGISTTISASTLNVVGISGGSVGQLPTIPGGALQPTVARDWSLAYIGLPGGPHVVVQPIVDPASAVQFPYQDSLDRPEFRPFGPIASAPKGFPPVGTAVPGSSGPPSPTPVPTPVPPSSTRKYVALGDSFSSGEGAPSPGPGASRYLPGSDQGDNRCHRSAAAYGPLKATSSSYDRFQFHACSGALIEDFFTSFGSNHPNFLSIPANAAEIRQLDWLTKDTTLTTLTVGGNNAKFADVMDYCAKRFAFERSCRQVWAGAVNSAITNMSIGTGHAQDNLPDLYAAIRGAAPNAKVLVLGYPRFFPNTPPISCRTGVPSPSVLQPRFTRSDMKWINAEVASLNRVIQQKAAAAGLIYVDTYNAFEGHELCNGKQSEWMNRVVLDLRPGRTQQSYHPNVSGQEQLWRLIAGHLGPPNPDRRLD